MPVVPDKYLLTTTEEETRQMVWASTFGYVHWYVRRRSFLRGDESDEEKKELYDFARQQAVSSADEAAAAYEEHIQKCREEEYGCGTDD